MSRDICFIHAADLHLDSPMKGLARMDDEDLAEAFRRSTRRSFKSLVNLALEREVSFVLLAGDVSDRGWKDANTAVFFNRQVARLTNAGIHVFLVWGNHDIGGPVERLLPANDLVHPFPSNRAGTVSLADLGVAVHGRSLSRSVQMKNLVPSFPKRVEGQFNIGLIHTSLNGREDHDPYAPCSLEDLLAKNYDYWALGHVHAYEQVSRDPWVVFSGCIQGRHVRETGPKGAVLVTLDGGEVDSVEFLELDRVRWTVIEQDVGGMESIDDLERSVTDRIEAAASEAEGRPLAVRIRLLGRGPLSTVLGADPWRWEERIRELAAGVGAGLVAIESLRFDLDVVQMESATSVPRNVIEEVIEQVRAMPGDQESIKSMKFNDEEGGMARHLEDVIKKIPPADLGDVLTDEHEIERIMAEAKNLLVSRLLTLSARDDTGGTFGRGGTGS